jgi:hypothetical protein
MNLGAARVRLRMRGAIDVLDLAAPLCRDNWRVLVPLGIVTLVPALALCLLARYALRWDWGAVWILAVVLGGLAHAPFTMAHGELLFADPRHVRIRPRAILARMLRRLPAFLAVHLLSRALHLLAAVTVFLLPVSGWLLFLVHEAVLLEGARPFAALARSTRAVRGQAGGVMGVSAALVLLPALGAVGGELAGSAIVEWVLQLGQPFGSLWTTGGTPYALAGFFATIPLSAAARFLNYLALRTRKEGWDIQLRFLAIATETDAAPAAQEPEAA